MSQPETGKATKTGKDKKAAEHRITEGDLTGYRFFRRLVPLLDHLHDTYRHNNRDLHFDQFVSLMLFYFFNPVLAGLRGIAVASSLKKVQKVLGVKPTSKSSLSEASHLFDAALLEPLISRLARQAVPVEKDPQLRQIEQALIAMDGTLLPALPKMLWALWLDDEHRAAKLHLSFSIMEHVPVGAIVTDGNASERTMLRRSLRPDCFYVLDAGYAEYALLWEIVQALSSFVVRLKDNAVWETVEERPLTAGDRAAGVVRDLTVRLGCQSRRDDYPDQLRIIEVEHIQVTPPRKSRVSGKKTFRTRETSNRILLATNRFDLSAEVLALLYRNRWQVELFFRWFKCVLGFGHLLALSLNGLKLQVYCALIVSLLITVWTGRKPTKLSFQMICMYLSDWADEEEIVAYIEKLQKSDFEKKAD